MNNTLYALKKEMDKFIPIAKSNAHKSCIKTWKQKMETEYYIKLDVEDGIIVLASNNYDPDKDFYDQWAEVMACQG